MPNSKIYAILSSLSASLHVVRATADLATVTITAAPEYAVEQACVQECLFQSEFGILLQLPLSLGCTRFATRISFPEVRTDLEQAPSTMRATVRRQYRGKQAHF